MYTRIKIYYGDYVKVTAFNWWMFASLTLIPLAFGYFAYRVAVKCGDVCYTGDQPLPTQAQALGQIAYWGRLSNCRNDDWKHTGQDFQIDSRGRRRRHYRKSGDEAARQE
jgi:hypothetical protein